MATPHPHRIDPAGRAWHPWPWASATALLLAPLLAMQLTNDVRWGLFDFVVAGGLLFGACVAFELAARRGRLRAYRWGAALGIGNALALAWLTLAVGVLGSERDPANAMFLAVIAVGGLASLIAWGRARAMAWAMAATALMQAGAAWVGWQAGFGFDALLALGFAVPWLASAVCFARAATLAKAWRGF